MSIEAAIMVLVWVLVIVAVAYVAVWIAGQMGAPQPVRMIIWGIALLLILIVLLRMSGFLHAEELILLDGGRYLT